MLAGAGRASLAISASASSAAAGIAGSSSSVTSGSNLRIIGAPEIIEVEPIVRRAARVVSHPVGKALNRLLQLGLALGPLELQLVGERLEMQVVAIPAAVQAEAQ